MVVDKITNTLRMALWVISTNRRKCTHFLAMWFTQCGLLRLLRYEKYLLL